MANIGLQIAGPAASSFSVGSNTCGSTLAAGATCSVQVTFSPTIAGGCTATLVVSSSTMGVDAVQVPVSGTGLAVSGLDITPAQLAFAQTQIGQSSAPVPPLSTGNTPAGKYSVGVTATANGVSRKVTLSLTVD